VTHEQLQELLIQIAPLIDEFLNPDRAPDKQGLIPPRQHGFLLCAFEFGEQGSLAYIANAQPSDLKDAMLELISKLDATALRVSVVKE
jgi:hypothetical protein